MPKCPGKVLELDILKPSADLRFNKFMKTDLEKMHCTKSSKPQLRRRTNTKSCKSDNKLKRFC